MTLTTTRPRSGCFIAVEGIDGSGSTTHAKRLADALADAGNDVRLTAEPTQGPVGSLIRQVLQHRVVMPGASDGPRTFAWTTMALLFAADRLDHLHSYVVPALEHGAVVITDRYDLSSLAYQSVTAPGGADVLPWIRALNSRAIRPDLTIVLDVPPNVAADRRKQRGAVEELFEGAEIQARLAAVYAEAEQLVAGDHLIHISGIGPVADVAASVLSAVRAAELPIR